MQKFRNNREKFVYSIWNTLFAMIVVAYVLAFFSEDPRAPYPAYALGAVLTVFAFVTTSWQDKAWRLTCGFLVLVAGVFTVNIAYHGMFSYNLVTIVINVIIGYMIYSRGLNRHWTLVVVALLAIFFIVEVGVRGAAPSMIFPEHSKNHISNLMLGSVVLWYVAASRRTKDVSLIPALVCFCICIMALGRSGVLASGILLGGMFLNRVFVLPVTLQNKVLSLAGGFSVIIVGIVFSREIMEWLNPLVVRFEIQGVRSISRVWIIEDYLKSLDLVTGMIGLPQRFTYMASGLSAHISFIQWHISMGIMALVLMGLAGYSVFKLFFINKIYCVILVSILLRASTDHLMLTAGFFYGPVLCYLIFVALWGEPLTIVSGTVSMRKNGEQYRRRREMERSVRGSMTYGSSGY